MAYIGDDFNDIRLLEQVGISATPPNASSYIQQRAQFVTKRGGGEGAFRDFVETILQHCGALETAVDKTLGAYFSQ